MQDVFITGNPALIAIQVIYPADLLDSETECSVRTTPIVGWQLFRGDPTESKPFTFDPSFRIDAILLPDGRVYRFAVTSMDGRVEFSQATWFSSVEHFRKVVSKESRTAALQRGEDE